MKIRVHMLAHSIPYLIRNVTIPGQGALGFDSILDQAFYCGQNEFADDEDLEQNLPSVSCGDVIEYPRRGILYDQNGRVQEDRMRPIPDLF